MRIRETDMKFYRVTPIDRESRLRRWFVEEEVIEGFNKNLEEIYKSGKVAKVY